MAKRFTFRFDTMLKIRKQREDQRKRVVADRLREIGRIQDRMASLHAQIENEVQAIRTGQEPGTIDLQQAMRHRYWLGHLHKNSLEIEARLRYHEAQLAQERAALAEAAKQRRILEKLKERQWNRYLQEEDKRETMEADEMSTIRYVFDRNVTMAGAVK